MSNSSILYEDDFIRVIYKNLLSQNIIVTFINMVTLAQGLSFYAEKPLEKLNLSSIGFMAKNPNWYPITSMLNAYQSIKHILISYQKRIGYGGSMGGYAAIKYSKTFHLDRVVSLDPQYSINPNDIRYKKYYQNYNKNMKIQRSDISNSCEYFIIYDPYYDIDKEHVDNIIKNINNVNIINLKFAEHSSTSIIASTKMLNYLFLKTIKIEEIYKKLREIKRENPSNKNFYIAKLLKKNPERLLYLIKNNTINLDHLKQNLKFDIIQLCFKNNIITNNRIPYHNI